MVLSKFGLLPRVILAIVAGLILGDFLGVSLIRFFATFNDCFSQFLSFAIPMIILGLVAPGIADLGTKGGRLLLLTIVFAYCFTLFSGLFSYCSCSAILPGLLGDASVEDGNVAEVAESGLNLLSPFFSLELEPAFGVLAALLLAFIFGIGMTAIEGETLKRGFLEFREIVEKLIARVIVPLLPLHIFGIFLNMSHSGTALRIIMDFGKVIGLIFVLHILLLLIQFTVAGLVSRRNPLRMLWTMLPAYMTALGTSSSAATIPVTLGQAKKMGINEDIADFCIPLCATIHLSGSMLKIVATALAICLMDNQPHGLGLFSSFIALLAVMMVAAPGVPGGAIMASLGVLQSVLGFNEPQLALMIAIYLAIDSFGTAGNVTGDGAIAAIIDRIAGNGTPNRSPQTSDTSP